MHRASRVIFWGLLTGWIGIMTMVPAGMQKFEEHLDLAVLFKLRGPRSAPPEVVIVNIDPASARQLNITSDPSQWPRNLHARLIQTLSERGARSIAFDVVFRHPRSVDGDRELIQAVNQARNVVLCGYLQEEILKPIGPNGRNGSDVYVERLIPPMAPLVEKAAGVAPFPLPKQPVRLNQFWAFKTSAGGMASLPVMAFQVYAATAFDDLTRLMNRVVPELVLDSDSSGDAAYDAYFAHERIRRARQVFSMRPDLSASLRSALEKDPELGQNSRAYRLVSALIGLYSGADSRFINFYGPPETITTIPYTSALASGSGDGDAPEVDFRGKAVFVGLSERIRNDQADGFYTIFSQKSGVDISGVEVAASVFANMLEEKPVRPLRAGDQIGLLGVWGGVTGAICLLSPLVAAMVLLAAAMAYLFGALQLFTHTGIWLPLTIPLLVQAPFSFLGTQFWRHFKTARERRNIRQAFGYHLPAQVVDRLARNFNYIREDAQTVYGICLFTDARQYTCFSETLPPEQLSIFLTRYYQKIFEPIQENGGIISDVKGDSMLALWNSSAPDPDQFQSACRAAIQVSQAVNQPTSHSRPPLLPTRIGLHAGDIRLGHIGAGGHFEYRPVGDIVNTASRIEGLNKKLGTDILISEEIALSIDGFFTRKMGTFIVPGKTRPVTIYELMGEDSAITPAQRELERCFTLGLTEFRRRNWQEARRHFANVLALAPEDHAAKLYQYLCRQYQVLPPDDGFEGVVVVSKK
jgi:adenylate cyclase